MAEQKKNALMAVDPGAQKLIRDCTEPFVEEMVMVLVEIARSKSVGPRDRTKAAVRVLDYHARGGSPQDTDADGAPRLNVVVVNTSNAREMDEAADELRRLNALTTGGGKRS